MPEIHRRLRRNLGRFCGDSLEASPGLEAAGAEGPHDEGQAGPSLPGVHQWDDEAPHAQLNGGSDPVIVTATHVVCHGRSGVDPGGDGGADGPRPRAGGAPALVRPRPAKGRAGDRGAQPGIIGLPGGDAGGGSDGGACRGGSVILRIRAYNATNARLHGFIIRLSFGQGAEVAAAALGGIVEAHVDEVRRLAISRGRGAASSFPLIVYLWAFVLVGSLYLGAGVGLLRPDCTVEYSISTQNTRIAARAGVCFGEHY